MRAAADGQIMMPTAQRDADRSRRHSNNSNVNRERKSALPFKSDSEKRHLIEI